MRGGGKFWQTTPSFNKQPDAVHAGRQVAGQVLIVYLKYSLHKE